MLGGATVLPDVDRTAVGPDRGFADTLRALWAGSGETQAGFATSVGLPLPTLRNWLSGHTAPTLRHADLIERLEHKCGVPQGELAASIKYRSRRGRACVGRYDGIDDPRSLRDRITGGLTSAEMGLPAAAFRARYAAVKAELVARRPRLFWPDVMQRRKEAAQPFVVPEPLKAEFAMLRRLSQLAEVDVADEFLPVRQRRDGGFLMQQSYLTNVMRHLATECGCPPEQLSLAMLLFPRLAQIAVGAKQRRMVQLEAASTMHLANTDLATFAAARDLVAAPNGLIFQRRDMFLPRLITLRELVSAQMIAEVEANWRGACAAAAKRYEDLRIAYGQFVVSTIDRKQPVDVLLNHPNPLFGLNMLNERLAQACLAADPAFANFDQLISYAVQSRISSDCGFRAMTLSLLELGDLIETADGWRLEVPRQRFKNPEGPYFRLHGGRFRDFERLLAADHGIADIIETYLSRVRPKLPGARHSSKLFVGVANRVIEPAYPVAFGVGEKAFSRRSKAFTGQFLCGIDGIPGLSPFGVHNFRDLLATGTLKETNEPNAAADAICDSVEIVLAHYVRYWRPATPATDRAGAFAQRSSRCAAIGRLAPCTK